MHMFCAAKTRWRWANFVVVSVIVLSATFAVVPAQKAQAVAQLVQVKTAAARAKTISATLSPAAKPNHLLVVVCAAQVVTPFTTPAGFTIAKTELATAPVQAMYYKVATGGETTVACAGGNNTNRSIQVYEYAGTARTSPLEAVNAVTSTGNSANASSGSVTTTSANTLLVAGLVMSTGGAGFSTWSNTFTERADFTSTARFGGADRYPSAAGTYSTVGTNSVASAWRGQIAAFKLLPIGLSADIVDAGNVSITSPSVVFANRAFDFACQTTTATLGITAQQLRVVNTTSTAAWTLGIAATSGATATWSNGGTKLYDYNDPTGAGCNDGGDADGVAGQLSVNPASAVITPDSSCSNNGVSLGVNTTFSEGITDSVPLLSGSASSEINCMWNVTGIGLSQTIPAEQSESSYSLGLTLTLAAN